MVNVLTTRSILSCLLSLYILTLLTACASSTRNIYKPWQTVQLKEEGYSVQQGQANIVNPGLIHWTHNDQLALMPGGPYIFQHYPLENTYIAITKGKKYAYVITQSNNTNNLLIIHFPDIGQAYLAGKIQVPDEVVQLHYANDYLLLASNSGNIQVLDVSNPELPVKLLDFASDQAVIDVQFEGSIAYLLLKSNTLQQIKLSHNKKDNFTASITKQWSIPLPATAIAVRDNFAWISGDQGVTVLELHNDTTTVIETIKISGGPIDIQLYESLALINNKTGSLVLFDISNTKKLQWVGSYNKRAPTKLKSFQISHASNHIETSGNVAAIMDNNTILSIGFNNPELPSSGPIYKAEYPIITNTFLGNDVLIATQHNIQRIVLADAGNYAISPEGTNQGGSRRGVIRDNILYVADWFSGLHLYDISNPLQPRHLSNYHTPGSSKGVTLFGNYALVGDDDQGLQIIDIKNPVQPQWVSELTPDALSGEGLAYTMKRVGHILYLADHRGGFHIIDLSDIRYPKRLGGYDTPGKSWGIDVLGQHVFVADDQSGLLVFDVKTPSQPVLVAQFDPGGQAEDVVIQGDHAFVAFFDKGLYVLDIHNPRQPRVLGHTTIPGNARGIELSDGLAYVAGWESGIHIVEISNPESPHIIGSFDTDGSAWGVNVKAGIAYVLDWWGGIKIIDVSKPTNPTYVGQYHARNPLQQLRARDRYLYAASGHGGLQVFDMKNPLNPIWIRGLDIQGFVQDIWHDETQAYVASGEAGVAILDTLDPFYTTTIGHIETPGQAQQVRALNDLLFISDNQAGILVFDTRDPQKPVEIDRIPLMTKDLWIDEQAFWAATSSGLSWWQHQNGFDASNRRHYPIVGGVDWVRTREQIVITARGNGLIQFWDRSSRELSFRGGYQAGEPLLDIQVDDKFLYLMGKHSGLMVIDIQNPEAPRLTTVYPSTGAYTGFEITGGAAFFAGEHRLASVTLLPSPSHPSSPSGKPGLRLPADLPVGRYHLLKITPAGEKQLFPEALHVQRARKGSSRSILQKYRQMLKSNP